MRSGKRPGPSVHEFGTNHRPVGIVGVTLQPSFNLPVQEEQLQVQEQSEE